MLSCIYWISQQKSEPLLVTVTVEDWYNPFNPVGAGDWNGRYGASVAE